MRALRAQHEADVLKRAAELEATGLAARRVHAAVDAADTRKAEAILVKAGRLAAVNMLTSLANINGGLRKASTAIASRFDVDETRPITMKEMQAHLKLLSDLSSALSQAVNVLMEMERRVAGEPGQLQPQPAAPAPKSMDEVKEIAKRTLRTIERAKARGFGFLAEPCQPSSSCRGSPSRRSSATSTSAQPTSAPIPRRGSKRARLMQLMMDGEFCVRTGVRPTVPSTRRWCAGAADLSPTIWPRTKSMIS